MIKKSLYSRHISRRRKLEKIKNLFAIYGTIAGSLIAFPSSYNKKLTDPHQDYNYAMDYYYNNNFDEYLDKELSLYLTPIDDSIFEMLPSTLEKLQLQSSFFISDLSKLPNSCPNLTYLVIDRCPNVNDYSFIYKLDNLKYLYLYEPTDGISQDLVDYLNNKGIKHNISNEMIDYIKAMDEMYDSLNLDNLNENDKVKTITSFIINHIECDYDAMNDDEMIYEYNVNSIMHAINGKGVCINFAMLFQALCLRAGINSYMITDYEHAWNLVAIDNKYYYIDATNMNQLYSMDITNLLLGKDIGFFYKQDPYDTSWSEMKDIDDVFVPVELLNLIKETENNKTILERLDSNITANMVRIPALLLIIVLLMPSKKRKEEKQLIKKRTK